MKTLDKDLTQIKIQKRDIISEPTLLRFAAMDIVIDPTELTITQESTGSIDATSKYETKEKFEEEIESYIWIFNN